MTVDSGEEFTVEVRCAFDDVEDISAVPTHFTPACDGHPLAPIAGPIVVRGANPAMALRSDCCPLSECADTRPKRGGQQQLHR
jgi:acetamidase/formamidase